jgi:hypothetical protein
MAIKKAFVIKNGLEVSSNALVVNDQTNNVGVGSTNPRVELDLRGRFIATDSYLTGISTVINELNVGPDGSVLTVLGIGSIGVGTISPAYLLDIRSPVSTGQTALYVQGDTKFTGSLVVGGDISFDKLNVSYANISGITTTNNLNVTNISTLGVTTTTNLTAQNLNVSGITTTNSLSIDATQVISSARQLQNITSLDGTTTSTIESAVSSAPITFTDLKVSGVSTFVGLATFRNGLQVVSGVTTLGVTTTTSLTAQSLNVSGVSTLGTVKVSSGVVTATSGIVTYYGDGSKLTGNARNLTATIGLGTVGGLVGYGVSFIYLKGSGVSTTFYNSNSGIATIFLEAGGGGVAGSQTLDSTLQLGNTSSLGMSVGVITATYFVGNGSLLTNVPGSSNSGYANTAGIATYATNAGISTYATRAGIATYATSSGIATYATSAGIATYATNAGTSTSVIGGIASVTQLYVSSGITTLGIVTAGNIYSTGIVTATSFVGSGSGLTEVSIGPTISINTTGIITATSFKVGTAVTISSSGIDINSNIFSRALIKNCNEEINVIGNTGTAATINLANGNFVTATLTGNCTFTFTLGITAGAASFTLFLTNDSTSSRSIVWPTSVKWPNSSVPVRTTTGNATDVYTFFTLNSGTTWYGNLSLYNYT